MFSPESLSGNQFCNELNTLDMASLIRPEFGLNQEEWNGPAGKEHYRLLVFMAQHLENKTIVDIGTHKGASALALSQGRRSQVHSFDISHQVAPSLVNSLSSVHFHVDDCLSPQGLEKYRDLLLASNLIFVDVDPHEGHSEFGLYSFLRDNHYQGFLCADDIWQFDGMRDNFWSQVPLTHKLDLTEVGHSSGSGFISFENRVNHSLLLGTHWTLVTGYFDLTRCPDASPEIKARPAAHYLESARATLAIPAHMVIFCEEENLEALQKLRPSFLAPFTRWIVQDFEAFPLTRYREKILANRLQHPYAFDPRNTASYYLLCMARYAMLTRAIQENSFASTHFAWVNICIQRMGFHNLIAIQRFLESHRNLVSICYIDYLPRSLVCEDPAYWDYGRCSLCSGFFTGNTENMLCFCGLVEEKFLECLAEGHGHSDETLFAPVFHEHRSLFKLYPGDYASMVTNFQRAVHSQASIFQHVLTKAHELGDYEISSLAARALLKQASHPGGLDGLSREQKGLVILTYLEAQAQLLRSPEQKILSLPLSLTP